MDIPSRRLPRSTSCANREPRPASPCASSLAARASTRAVGRPRSGMAWTGPPRSFSPTTRPSTLATCPSNTTAAPGSSRSSPSSSRPGPRQGPERNLRGRSRDVSAQLLSHNLLRRFVLQTGLPHLQTWRASWVRRVLLLSRAVFCEVAAAGACDSARVALIKAQQQERAEGTSAAASGGTARPLPFPPRARGNGSSSSSTAPTWTAPCT